jgi:hypothetical protein
MTHSLLPSMILITWLSLKAAFQPLYGEEQTGSLNILTPMRLIDPHTP